MQTPNVKVLATLKLTYRILGVVLGSYALWAGSAPLFGLGLTTFGIALANAILLSTMASVLVFVAALIWGFAIPIRWRPASHLLLLGTISMALASYVTPEGLHP